VSRAWPALDLHFPTDRETTSLRNRALAALDDFQPTALTDSDAAWRAYFQTPAARDRAAEAMARLFGADGLRLAPVDEPDEDWARRSQEGLPPIQVGSVRVLPSAPPPLTETAVETGIGPVRSASSTSAGLTIVIEPSMGFGTGHHATTRLCLALLQQIDLRGSTVLDVGCGSGILSIAAAGLGAAQATGIDHDADAIESARRNLALNPGLRHVVFESGDIRTMTGPRSAVVLANLTGAFLTRHAGVLMDRLAPGGSCILSGILVEEEQDVRRAFAALPLAERRQEEEWVGLRYGPASTAPPRSPIAR